MEAINYTEIVNNWPLMMRQVTDDQVPLIITSTHCKPVVMMSLEDFNAWQETEYLTRSPANAKDLMEAMQELQDRQTLVRQELLEEAP
jgi:antitoxin YefM